MKIKIIERQEVEKEVDIDFPLYLESDDSYDYSSVSWTKRMRIGSDGMITSFTQRFDAGKLRSIEAEHESIDLTRGLHNYLNRSYYSEITRDAFTAYRDEFIEYVIAVDRVP